MLFIWFRLKIPSLFIVRFQVISSSWFLMNEGLSSPYQDKFAFTFEILQLDEHFFYIGKSTKSVAAGALLVTANNVRVDFVSIKCISLSHVPFSYSNYTLPYFS